MEMGTIFRALADDSRLRIMLLLSLMELSVGELAAVLGQSQPRVSRHVRILVEAGLAERHKEGSWVFLRPALARAADEPSRLLDALLRQPSLIGPTLARQHGRDSQRLAEIRAQRESRAAAFFATHADQWDAIRSLHVPEADIEATLSQLLAPQAIGRLLDIGTGTGRVAELFAPSSNHCTALDRSPEMLRLARARLQHLPPERLTLVQGDFYALPFDDAVFDTIILHQVLHFAQSPQAVIAEASRVAGPGGRLVVVDFAPHQMEELRERDAHARLGFSDEQIASYCDQADLKLDRTETLKGGTLTVKIWLARRAGAGAALPIERPARSTDKEAA